MAQNHEKNIDQAVQDFLFDSGYYRMPIIPQDDFPNVDLMKHNAELLEKMLVDPGISAQGSSLVEAQATIHHTSTRAFEELGMGTTVNPRDLESFSQGFAAFELLSSAVRARPNIGKRALIGHAYNVDNAQKQAWKLFLKHAESASSINQIIIGKNGITTTDELRQAGNPHTVQLLSQMYVSWYDERPNTYELVFNTAPAGYSDAQKQSRTIGARIAYQLQLAA